MAAWGACRLCMVEVEGLDKLQAACTTWVADGLVVKTDTPRVRATRESYLQDVPLGPQRLLRGALLARLPHAHRHPRLPGGAGRRRRRRRRRHRARRAAVPRHPGARLPALLRARLPARRGGRPHRHLRPAPRGRRPQPTRVLIPGLPERQARRRHRRRTGRPGRRLVPHREAATRSRSTTPTTKAGGSLRYSIPEFRLPEKVVDKELEPLWEAGVRFVGESELGYEVDPDGLLDAGFDAVVIGVGTWEEPKHVLPGDDAALRGLDILKRVREGRAVKFTQKVAVIGDGITALDAARTARRLGAKEVVVIAQHEGEHIPAGARDLAAALEEGVKFEFGTLAKKVKAKAGKAQGVECVRVVREKGRTKEVRGSRFDVAATTVVLATGLRAQARRQRRVPAARRRRAAPGQLLHRPHARGRRVRRRRRRHRRAVGRSTPSPAASAPRWPSTPGCAAQTSRSSRSKLAVYTGLPYLEQLKDAGAARRAGPAPGRAQPGVAQDGRERRACGSRHHAQGRQGQAALGHRRRGREGLQPGRRPSRGRCAACSASAPAWATATCRGSAWSTASPTTSSSSRARWCAASRPSTSTRSSGATWTAASPAGAACASAATWPARPATTSPGAASR